MNDGTDLAERIRFLQIDGDTRQALQEFAPALRQALPAAIEDFYRHLRSWPELIRLFNGEAGIQHAKEAQTRHWLTLFSGRFDIDYVNSVRRIAQVHSRIGLDQRWYIGGYAVTISRLYAACVTTMGAGWMSRGKRDRLAALLRALNQAVMLDIELTIAVYMEHKDDVRRTTVRELAENFRTTVAAVVPLVAQTAKQVHAGCEVMVGRARETTDQSRTATQLSERTSTNVQAVAAAAEELTSSIVEVSRQIQQSAEIAGRAMQAAQQTDRTVSGLAEAANRIGEVVHLISAIASQTNLLALNATIEAARAGEAGKGFAVVATEVKNLAAQTAKATDEITAQINAIRESTKQAVAEIRGIAQVISEVNEISGAVSRTIGAQQDATRDIARNVHQAAEGTEEVTQKLATLFSAAEVTTAAATQANDSSIKLAGLSTDLHAALDRYLSHLEAS